MAFHKALKDLNLLDRFLFAEAMEDPVIMQTILEIILGKDILLKYPPQAEKEKRSSPLFRFIRMDVWAMDIEDTVYDAEVQKEDTKNLPRRSRLYQSMIDTKLLDPGEVDFGRMNNVYTIMIAPFDLFGKGLYRYTFRMRCDEDPEIALDDGAARIFLNTRGKDPSGVSEELIELLRYIEHTTEEVSSSCRSGKIRELQRRIAMIKSSEEIGVKYMQEWEEKVIEQRRAREEGLEEGRAEGRAIGLAEGHAEGQAIGRAEGQEYQLFRMVRRKMLKGCEAEEIADILEEDLNHVGNIYDFLKTKMEQSEEESWAEWIRAKNQKK